jgi:hypothetical protein
VISLSSEKLLYAEFDLSFTEPLTTNILYAS